MIKLIFSLLFFSSFLYAESDFWSHWGDGKAEVSHYELKITRYGKIREGQASLIFVTEDLDPELQIKTNKSRDSVPVIKLNQLRTFLAGHYTYNMMLSHFYEIQKSSLKALKFSLNSFEWCGNYYSQYNLRPPVIEFTLHSYLEEQGDQQRQLRYSEDFLFEDSILLHSRNLVPGRKSEYQEKQLLSSLFYDRLNGQLPKWQQMKILPVKKSQISSQADRINVLQHDYQTTERNYSIYTADQYPHQIVRWEVRSAVNRQEFYEEAQLLTSERKVYW